MDEAYPVVIMNFSHIYEEEIDLRKTQYHWLDCTKITGTDCYLDGQAEREIVERIDGLRPEGIHFIDSGNYHYISKLWTDKIKFKFSLVVFDHHTDMQKSMFENIMSCGSWVKDVMDTNPYLNKVILLGAKESLINEIEKKYLERVVILGEEQIKEIDSWEQISEIYLEEPVYISIDKDVLSKQTVVTNWDQGTMKLRDLEKILKVILEKEEVIGIDICGEPPVDEPLSQRKEDDRKDDLLNKELITFIQEAQCKNIVQIEDGGLDEKASNY